jgi:hypothetical protein
MTLDLSLKTETRLLIDALRTAPIGQVVTFATLSAACGLDVQAQARGLLNSARRIVARDHGAVFVSERNVGLRRLRPEEAPALGQSARRRIRTTSGKAMSKMVALAEASNGLSPDAQRKLNAEMAIHGLLREIATDRNAERAQADTVKPPPLVAETFLQHLGITHLSRNVEET